MNKVCTIVSRVLFGMDVRNLTFLENLAHSMNSAKDIGLSTLASILSPI